MWGSAPFSPYAGGGTALTRCPRGRRWGYAPPSRGRASPAPVAAATYPSVIITAYKNSRPVTFESAVSFCCVETVPLSAAATKVFLERERGRGEREKPFFPKKGFLYPPRGVGQSPTRASADALRVQGRALPRCVSRNFRDFRGSRKLLPTLR